MRRLTAILLIAAFALMFATLLAGCAPIGAGIMRVIEWQDFSRPSPPPKPLIDEWQAKP
jgi:hypothetical protein